MPLSIAVLHEVCRIARAKAQSFGRNQYALPACQKYRGLTSKRDFCDERRLPPNLPRQA